MLKLSSEHIKLSHKVYHFIYGYSRSATTSSSQTNLITECVHMALLVCIEGETTIMSMSTLNKTEWGLMKQQLKFQSWTSPILLCYVGCISSILLTHTRLQFIHKSVQNFDHWKMSIISRLDSWKSRHERKHNLCR